MQLNTKKYDSFIKKHKKTIIAVWIVVFLISIPFAIKFFSVVSYNITGSTANATSSVNSTTSAINITSNSSEQQILLVVQSDNVYSNTSKSFLTALANEFPNSNVTSIYTIESSAINKMYYSIYNYALQAKAAFIKTYGNSSLTDAALTQIASEIYNNFSSSVSATSNGALVAGPTLFSFINGIVKGYTNSSPTYVYNNYNFPDFPILPSSAVLSGLVDHGQNVTMVSMVTTNYENTSSVVNNLANKHDITVYTAGAAALESSLESSTLNGTFIAILAGLLLAIIVTGVIFRSPVAAFVPLLIFALNIIISYSLFYIIFHFILNSQASFFDPVLTSILMLGLCTDYMIYILYRYRQERQYGKPQDAAASLAFGWAGGAVLVSGLTVISAYIVLSFLNLPFIGGSGTLNAVGISIVLLSGLTFLPALLHTAGDRLMYHNHRTKRSTEKLFSRVANFDRKHAKKIVAVFVVLAAVSFYIFITITPDFNIMGLLPSSSTKSAFYVASNNFGYDPIDPVSLTFSNGTSASASSATINGIRTISGVSSVVPAGVQNYNIYLNNFVFSKAALNTYNSIDSYLSGTGTSYTLNGTATFLATAYNAINGDIYPLIIILGAVIFTLLFIILYSLVTPLRLVLMLISILFIANAITITIFYIILSLPFIVFAQVFLITNIMGVGVDYDIFLVMRIREHARKGESNNDAIKSGLSKSGPVIISLGVILSSVFFGLAASGIPLLAEVGFIVGAGILMDTLVSILILIPAFMFLLSKYNWWPSKIGYDRTT